MSWAEVKLAVKSIQRGYATITNSDVTITLGKSVDPSRCIVLLDGFCGMYSYNSSSVSRASAFKQGDSNYALAAADSPMQESRGMYYDHAYGGDNRATAIFPYATVNTYSAARKPYVKALTETQLTIGQSGIYSTDANGATVSYQVIEFFN